MSSLNTDIIFKSLLSAALIYKELKSTYKKTDNSTRKCSIGSPYISYDIEMKSTNNRELIISLIDYGEKKKISVTIYNRESGSYTPLSLERYLVSECNLTQVEDLMKFDSDNNKELFENLNRFFKWLDKSQIESLSKILKGELWIELEFDWHGYK